MGKLIVLEGTDGSGKATQTAALLDRLRREDVDCRKIEFPRYQEESSALIREYLRGDFGEKPSDVNAFAASTFYAVDRYASYQQDWGGYYRQGGLVIADRYTTSNAVHQGSKLQGKERTDFFEWLFDYEIPAAGTPKAGFGDLLGCAGGSNRAEYAPQRDSDRRQRRHSRAGRRLSPGLPGSSRRGGGAVWLDENCLHKKGGVMRSIGEIHEDVYRAVKEVL